MQNLKVVVIFVTKFGKYGRSFFFVNGRSGLERSSLPSIDAES